MQYKHNANLVPYARKLRKNMTRQERHLWYDFLRGYPIRFQRQKVLGPYIVDFYCAQAHLVVELDVSQHFRQKQREADERRDGFLRQYGLTVIRIPNNAVDRSFSAVCTQIEQVVQAAQAEKKTP